MPLEQHLPRIDDRAYADLLAEARARIPRYTPEWTDLNDNDPGMALVQLFAWMTDLLVYRMGRVPELNYLKFLELIGIELRPAEAARAEIAFGLLQAPAAPLSVHVPERTQVAAESAEGPPVVFETDRTLTAITSRLLSIQAFDGYSFLDASEQNGEAARAWEPFGPQAERDSALYLGFDPAVLLPQATLNLAVVAAAPGAAAAFSDCSLAETAVFPSASLAWEHWDGTDWKRLTLVQDETRALERSGHVYVKLPAAGSIPPVALGAVAAPRQWLRARVERPGYERAPRLLAVRTNSVSAVQAETIRDEVLGGSDGSPNLRLRVANTPVLAGTLRLEVDEGDGFRPWTEVADLYGSSETDRHYTLNRTTGEVRFGDGRHGAIPTANVENPGGSIVAREYRFGGGKRGNVSAGALKTVLTSVPGVDDNAVTNLLPAFGGREEETLTEAKARAPRQLRSRGRAVTSEDFEQLAMEAANIRRARALPLHHPQFPGVKVPGAVTVVVVPHSEEPNPHPSEGTRRTVCAYLNARRLLAAELYVVGPTYQQVEVRAELIAQHDADLGEVQAAVERSLLDFFHPLRGGERGEGWPFGGDVHYSRVYQRVFTVPGVQRVQRLVILVDGEEAPECRDIPVPEGVLLFSTSHQVMVEYDFGA